MNPHSNGVNMLCKRAGATATRIRPICVMVARLERTAAALRILTFTGSLMTRCPMVAIVTVLEANPEAMAEIA